MHIVVLYNVILIAVIICIHYKCRNSRVDAVRASWGREAGAREAEVLLGSDPTRSAAAAGAQAARRTVGRPAASQALAHVRARVYI